MEGKQVLLVGNKEKEGIKMMLHRLMVFLFAEIG